MRRVGVGIGVFGVALVVAGCGSPEAVMPDDFVPEAVSIVDADTFWVLGRGGDGAALARTTDGGETFTALPTPNLPLAMAAAEFPATIEHVLFADAEHGWIYGDTLWSTHDGGESWTRLDEKVNHVATSGDSAYAVVSGGGETRLLRAPIDSDEWEQLDLDFGDLYPTELAAADDLVVLAGGDGQYEPAIWVSTNEADTFEQRETPCLPVHSEGELTAATADEIWLTCPTDDQATEQWHVMLSTDLGDSWEHTYTHQVERVGASWPMVTARDTGAATVTAEGTTDFVHIGIGNEAETVEITGYPLPRQVVFANPEDGLLLTSNGADGPRGPALLQTGDGGRTWNPVKFD